MVALIEHVQGELVDPSSEAQKLADGESSIKRECRSVLMGQRNGKRNLANLKMRLKRYIDAYIKSAKG